MENKRGSWSSSLGFMLAAIGSAVGLGNIWGFPYKMGRSGGFTFIIVYVVLAILVGFVIMMSEIAMGRKTGLGNVGAYKATSKKFGWVGWLGVIAPFLILSFYPVLGGYCMQYFSLNLAELSFGLQEGLGVSLSGDNTFGAMLTNPLGCVIFTVIYLALCFLINRSKVSEGIEKFNKYGMPALFVMLVIIIIRSVTMPGAAEGLKFMFKPGYAVEAGFIEEAPSFISVLATAGGQMFFSLSLAMGIMVTYGSYVKKNENIKKSSIVIIVADTIVALMAGLAVIPSAVAHGIQNGIPLAEIKLSGPNLLFVSLQNVFSSMGVIGSLFGAIFYLLVIIAAISSTISLIEVLTAYFTDNAVLKGKEPNRKKTVLWVCIVVTIEAIFVALDGLGASGIFKWPATGVWNDCLLDFMDCWSEGIAMPLGAMLMCLMIGWELKSTPVLEEIGVGAPNSKAFNIFYKICIMVVAPIIMALVFAGMIGEFFGNINIGYIIAGACLLVFFLVAVIGNKRKKNQI